MNVVDFRKRVEADGTSWATLRRDMRDELILQRVRERDVENRVRVSETEVDDFIRTNADLSNPSQLALNLAQVLIALPDNPTAEQVSAARAKAKGIFDRAKAGEDFGKLALANSQGPERNQGGQMGLREADRYPELFLQATQRLRAGDVAEPIQSGAGFHVIKVLQKRAAAMPDMTVTQTKVRHILLRTSPQLSQDAAARRLTELRQRIIAGQIDFATAARDNGQDATAQQGGDMGWATPGTFVPEFEEAMNQLPEGQVSPPVATRFGVHLLLVDARRDQTLGEREQRELVRNAVRAKKADDNFGNWVQEVRGRAFIDYRDQPQM
jgi:peptidyl-prolyl cis-trans isomerase SurA